MEPRSWANGQFARLCLGALSLVGFVVSGCSKSESAECSPTFGGGVECTRSESFDVVEWVKDNPSTAVILAVGAFFAGAVLLEQFGNGKRGTPSTPRPAVPRPSLEPSGAANAVGSGPQQRIANDVRVGDRVLTNVGPRRVLAISAHPERAHLIMLALDDGAVLTVGRADTMQVVPG